MKADNKQVNNNYLVEITTIQTSSFRTTIESLKEILKDVPIKFIPDRKDENNNIIQGGISIVAMNESMSVLIRLKLFSKSFEKFYISEEIKQPIIIGINMNCFNKLIKTIGNDETLTLFLERDDPNKLGIKIHNVVKGHITIYKLNLLELEKKKELNAPEAEFNSAISMPANDFHKIIRDSQVIGEVIDITFIDSIDTPNRLIFKCQGEFATIEVALVAKEKNNNTKTDEIIIQGLYDLKILSLFSKCANLCQNIDIYMKNNYPLIIKYQVASLGILYIVLSPKDIVNKIDEDEYDIEDE
jgi:proliferating cell nuclear antigen